MVTRMQHISKGDITEKHHRIKIKRFNKDTIFSDFGMSGITDTKDSVDINLVNIEFIVINNQLLELER